jgi:hypothetical protein
VSYGDEVVRLLESIAVAASQLGGSVDTETKRKQEKIFGGRQSRVGEIVAHNRDADRSMEHGTLHRDQDQ